MFYFEEVVFFPVKIVFILMCIVACIVVIGLLAVYLWLFALGIFSWIEDLCICQFCDNDNKPMAGVFNNDWCCFGCMDSMGLEDHPKMKKKGSLTKADVTLEEIPCDGSLE